MSKKSPKPQRKTHFIVQAKSSGKASPLVANQFKEALVKAIESSDISHNQIAKETGVRQQIISRFVSGERSISLENYAALASYFKLGDRLAAICGK